MTNNFETVAITSTSREKNIIDIAKQCMEVLENQDIKVVLTENLRELKQKRISILKSEESLIKRASLLIAIGGDGTMLSCARRFGSKGTPILGINLGNLGFLTDIAPEDVTVSLMDVVKGKFIKDERSFLEASINTEKNSYIALNEIVIHSGAIAQLIEFELFIDDTFVYRQRADGLIINTPTGSTAYALSGGGPIIHPSVSSITLLPMFPHSLSSSPLIIDDKSKIDIKLIGKRNKAKLNMDSHDSVSLMNGDIVSIKKADSTLDLIHPLEHDFYSSCRNKLGWSSRIS